MRQVRKAVGYQGYSSRSRLKRREAARLRRALRDTVEMFGRAFDAAVRA